MQPAAIRFREYPVRATLAPFVKCIWSVESDCAICDAPRERVLPDGCVELVIHFHDPFRSHFATGTNALQPQSFVAGQMRNFIELEPAGRVGLIAARFYARGAYLFFPKPLSAVTAAVVEVGDIWGKRALVWAEQIALAPGMRARVRILEEALLRLLREKDRYDPRVDRCLQLIEMADGQVRVSQLASEIGVSSRQLVRRFENAVGMSPKEFARVSRFLNGARRLRQRRQQPLTETALECGYFDQAHFNHDFREFAGMAPREFLSASNVVF